MIAKGNDPLLRTIATQEQAAPTQAADRETLGDGWWSAADARPDKAGQVLHDFLGDPRGVATEPQGIDRNGAGQREGSVSR